MWYEIDLFDNGKTETLNGEYLTRKAAFLAAYDELNRRGLEYSAYDKSDFWSGQLPRKNGMAGDKLLGRVTKTDLHVKIIKLKKLVVHLNETAKLVEASGYDVAPLWSTRTMIEDDLGALPELPPDSEYNPDISI